MTLVLNSFEELRTLPRRIDVRVREIDFSPPFREIMKELEDAHSLQFAGGLSPGGESLAPLAPTTIQRKGHDRILIDKGDLRRSLTSNSDNAIRDIITGTHTPGFSFGTRDIKSPIHKRGNRSRYLPKRVHVGTDHMGVAKMARLVIDHIIGTLVRGPLT